MVRRQPLSRRQPAFDDSSDESDVGAAEVSVRAPMDPLVAIQMADLSNNARDRQTAHDREQDRAVNLAAINKNRKCNQKGTEEAKNAVTFHKQLSGWNNFGGNDPTDNLDDIAGGQYHRQATSQKVQAEVYGLRIGGKEINAESIDAFRGHSVRRGASASLNQKLGRAHFPSVASARAKPLDPAIDPSREYRYKTGQGYGANSSQSIRGLGISRAGRGGRGAARGNHSTQVGRGSLTRSGDARNTISTSAPGEAPSGIGLGSRAKVQRGFQDRPWPPVALMGNPAVSLTISTAVQPVSSLASSNKTTSHVDGAPEVVPTPVDTKTASVRPAPNIPQPSSMPVKVQGQAAQLSLSQASQAVEPPNRIQNLADAANFENWFKSTPHGKAVKASTPLQPTTLPELSPVTINENLTVLQEGLRRQSIAEEQRTDGRLTPPTFTEEFSEDELLGSYTSVTPNDPTKPSATAGRSNNDQPDTAQILIDTDIPEDEQLVLAPVISQPTSPPRLSTESSEGKESGHVVPLQSEATETSIFATLPSRKSLDAGVMMHSTSRRSAVLQTKSPNRTPLAKSNVSKWASTSDSTIADMPETRTVISMPIRTAPAKITSLLGDSSNLRQKALVDLNSQKDLSRSRYASSQPVLDQPASTAIRRTQAGAGYDQLLRDLQQRNVAINMNRPPDQLAIAQASEQSTLFRHREPVDDASMSDGDEL